MKIELATLTLSYLVLGKGTHFTNFNGPIDDDDMTNRAHTQWKKLSER